MRLDPPVRAGGALVAALCQVRIVDGARHGALGAFVDKRPVAVLVRRGAAVTALALDGREMAAEEIEALCPGALAEMQAV